MKGVSPLIAAVLLVAFTVAIATLIMGWFSTFTRTTTSTVSNKTSTAIGCSNAQISIEDVYVKNATLINETRVTVIVKNTGYATIGLNSLQVYNTTGQNFSQGFVAATSIAPGSIVTYNVTNVSMITCPTTFSKAIVTSTCGGISDAFDSLPKCAA